MSDNRRRSCFRFDLVVGEICQDCLARLAFTCIFGLGLLGYLLGIDLDRIEKQNAAFSMRN